MSLFSSLKPNGGQKLHPFDLSRRDVFGAKAGVLNVNFTLHTIPESKYEVNHAQIMRTDPIQTASFARMSENYEYYFVPYSQIYHDFEKLYYERGDAQRNPWNSTMQPDILPSQLPNFDYYQVVTDLAEYFLNSRVWLKMYEQNPYFALRKKAVMVDLFDIEDLSNSILPFDVHGEICIDEMLKLFDNLGYGNLFAVFNSTLSPFFTWSAPEWNNFNLTADEDENVLAQIAYNRNLAISLSNSLHVEIEIPDETAWDDFDYQSGTGVNADLFEFFYSKFYIVLTQDGDFIPSYQNTTSVYNNLWTLINRFTSSSHALSNPFYYFIQQLYSNQRYPSVFALAAYLKVFADIYRNVQFDTANYASLFNYDYLADSGSQTVTSNKVIGMLLPRFRQYKKDVFTGLYPNAQFGSVAVSGLQNPTYIYGADNVGNGRPLYQDGYTGKVETILANGTVATDKWKIESGISALAIRQALSLQRYKERILRAGNRLTSLQNAVFGDRSRFIENSYVQFIGAEKNIIDFNSVAATSDAGNSEVGQLGSHGVGTHMGNAFEFHSHDFGIIIGIYYIMPEVEYESFMIDPMNTKTETNDFYKPDFMNLGLSPVFNYNFNLLGRLSSGQTDTVLGYLANYWEYKTSIDKVHGNFYSSCPFDVSEDGVMPDVASVFAFTRGQNSHYVTPRSSQSFIDSLYLGNLYVNPHDVDSIFYVNGDFTMNTDQFKINCNHDVKALLPMSVVGLPEY